MRGSNKDILQISFETFGFIFCNLRLNLFRMGKLKYINYLVNNEDLNIKGKNETELSSVDR